MKTIIKLILIFFGFQFLGGIVSSPILLFANEASSKTYLLGSTSCLGALFLIWYLLAKKKYIRIDGMTWSVRSAGILALTILLGFSFYYFAGGINELAGLPNILEEEFVGLSSTVLGVLGIVVLGPISEELLFRGAILGFLLTNGALKPKYAILISALIFGIIHMNPAQILYAFLLGLLLGRLYYQSGSLTLCIVIHVLLNGFSTLLTICYPNDLTFEDLSGSATLMYGLMVLGLLLSGVSAYYLNQKLKAPVWVAPAEVSDVENGGVTVEESK